MTMKVYKTLKCLPPGKEVLCKANKIVSCKMAASFDLIIFHGPPSPVVTDTLQHKQCDREDYVHVYPSQLYQDHPGFGVRDIANHVLGLLKKHKRVVVEDHIAGGAVRDCLLKVIPSKMPSCRIHVIELDPKHGQEQTLWERQFILATSPQSCRLLSDEHTFQWFNDKGCLLKPQSSVRGTVSKETVTFQLTATTNYKFEVPCLIVQWECVVDSGGYLQEKIKAVCRQWIDVNPCGRVIALCDGSAVAKGHLSAVQQKSQIVVCSKTLAKELQWPVFGVQVMSTIDAGDFSVPPNPGLLAFLQRRHCLDLHHRNTVYVYNDVRHMKMAEKAGIRHIKAGKVLRNPQMMKTCHSAIASPVPQMLHQIQLVADLDLTDTSPFIPLYDRLGTFSDHAVWVQLPRGLCEFVFAPDIQHLHNFQTRYSEHATPIGEPVSKMNDQQALGKSPHSTGYLASTSGNQASALEMSDLLGNQVSTRETSDVGVRQIPKWMLGRAGSSVDSVSTQPSLNKSSSTSSTEGRGRSRHTVYIMTEKELLETAKEMLKQAGREDLIETCILQSSEAHSTHTARRKDVGGEVASPPHPPITTCMDTEMTEIIPPTTEMTEIIPPHTEMTETIPSPTKIAPNNSQGTMRLPDPPDIYHTIDTTEIIGPTISSARASEENATTLQRQKSKEKKEDVTMDIQDIASMQTSHLTHAPQNQQTTQRRKAPDLSILDEIFF